jgi:Tol biopolymer transport system component
MADGYISSFNAKYHYRYWRPVTAIQTADTDGNPDTAGDPTWTPDGSRILFQSPPEPSPGHAQNFFTIQPDGTGLRQITHYEDAPGKYVGVFHPCFSPDGRYFSASELIGNDRPGNIAIFTAEGHRILRMPSPLIENNVEWGPLG